MRSAAPSKWTTTRHDRARSCPARDAERQLAELRLIVSDGDDDGDEGIWPIVDTISYTAPLTRKIRLVS
jgi:hypothetical protein